MTDRHDVLIVGAGHAGAQAAIALRQNGFTGTLALLGDERELPYERPPLSKDYLLGDRPFDRLLLRPAAFWSEREIILLPGRRVVAVDPQAHRVVTADGGALAYGPLIWATGGVARRLACEGAALEGAQTIRSRADVDRIVTQLPTTRRAVIVGGGYIGLEAASALRKLGKDVVVLEAMDRVLARVAGEPLSRFFEAEHRAHGVDVRLGATVERIVGADGRVSGVRLADGESVAAEMVIVGIGIAAAAAPLLSAGADGANGVLVDAQCRTSLPDIFAVGDCALHANRFADGALVRLESVQNANDQATVAAKVILGQDAAYDLVPWFWSNQYDLRLQTIGLSAGHDETIVRGDPAGRSFSVVYRREGRVIALDCVNHTRDYVQGRALVLAGSAVEARRLADPAIPLKEIAATSAAA